MSSAYDAAFSTNGDGVHSSPAAGDLGHGGPRDAVLEALAREAGELQGGGQAQRAGQDTPARGQGAWQEQPLGLTPQGSPEKEVLRDGRGRFAKGTRGGPGNPYNREVARIKQTLQSLMTEEDVLAMGRAMIEEIKK